jgi:hypothetical protein
MKSVIAARVLDELLELEPIDCFSRFWELDSAYTSFLAAPEGDVMALTVSCPGVGRDGSRLTPPILCLALSVTFGRHTKNRSDRACLERALSRIQRRIPPGKRL